MRIVETAAEVRGLAAGQVGFVPTLGFIHEGHMDLMKRARAENDLVLASVFVNPLQFNVAADFDAYPRDLERDAALMEAAGVDVLFAPALEEMYPTEPVTEISLGPVTESMEGAHRPGHFEGVALVVAKLLSSLQPDRGYFGKKDAQQLAVISRMVLDLSIPTEIVPCSTVREVDGLALSSRNVRIEPSRRPDALKISAGLLAAAELVGAGERSAAVLEAAVRAHLTNLDPEYVTLATADLAQPVDSLDRQSFLAVACNVGDVRLIDNVTFSSDGTADVGTRLPGPSALYEGRS